MLQVLTKFRIDIKPCSAAIPTFTIYIHDNFLSNVIRKFADLSFDFDVQFVRIEQVRAEYNRPITNQATTLGTSQNDPSIIPTIK